MVLCAETPDRTKAELLRPPEGSQVGDLVHFKGFERKPIAELHNKKEKNQWIAVESKCKINDNGVASFEDAPMQTDKGVITSLSITNGVIHWEKWDVMLENVSIQN